ncbi:MAG: hypothetical protein AAB874_01270 [Patescibacteria group bacterium]
MRKCLVVAFTLVSFLFISAHLTPRLANANGMFPTADDHKQSGQDYINQKSLSTPVYVTSVNRTQLWDWVCLLGHPPNACTDDPEAANNFNGSVLGFLGNSVASIYANPPASTHTYLADLGQRAGIVKPAYAQGIGFGGLTPILPVWRAFRNISYGFLILVLVMIGFMVLFRAKIDPRTVVSIQSALPRVVITLVLITFSYAIAGLLIDAMYLTILFMITAVGSALPSGYASLTDVISYYTGGGVWALMSAMWSWEGVNALTSFIGGVPLNLISGIAATLLVGVPLAFTPLAPFAIPAGAAAGAAGLAVPNVLVALIVLIAVIFAMFRVFILLITAYIQIIFSIIFAPLQLMIGAIPNVDMFGTWVRGVIANLAVFPITIAMLLLGAILTHSTASQGNLWVPPGLGGNQAEGVAAVIGLAIMLTIPNVAGAVKEMLKVKPLVQASPGVVFGPLGSIGGATMQGVSMSYYLKGNPIVERLKGLLNKRST